MRSRPDAQVRLLVPVGAVVAGTAIGQRKVAHFVLLVTCLFELLHQLLVLLYRLLFGEFGELALLLPPTESGVGFDGEAVGRNMRELVAKQLFEVLLPLRQAVAGHSVNEVGR